MPPSRVTSRAPGLSVRICADSARSPDSHEAYSSHRGDAARHPTFSTVDISTLAYYSHAHQTGGSALWADVVLVGIFLLWPVLSIWFLRRDDGGRDDSEGGGGSGRPPPEPPPPAPEEPRWWPDFEREFAAYVRVKQTAAVPSASRSRRG